MVDKRLLRYAVYADGADMGPLTERERERLLEDMRVAVVGVLFKWCEHPAVVAEYKGVEVGRS